MASDEFQIKVVSLRGDPNYAKCPRCWSYHSAGIASVNFMGMCDRCCFAILEAFNDPLCTPQLHADLEPFVAGIKVAHKAQLERFRAA